MGIDYYGVLKVPKSASLDECKKAYRRLAMKWHPDKHLLNTETARAKLEDISKAYQVLGDAERRKRYDDLGEEGLTGDHFQARDALEVFAAVFGFSSPVCDEQNLAGGLQGALQKVFKSALDVTTVLPDIQIKAPPIELKLQCTLEELYNGSTRRVKISRNETDASGKTIPVEEILTVNVKPGWKAGTRVTFPGKGSRNKAGMAAPDVALVIEEKPHSMLRREGDDLVAVMRVALVDALTGYAAKVGTLDGRVLMVPCVQVVRPGMEVVVEGEGMPVQNLQDDHDGVHELADQDAIAAVIEARAGSEETLAGQPISTVVTINNNNNQDSISMLRHVSSVNNNSGAQNAIAGQCMQITTVINSNNNKNNMSSGAQDAIAGQSMQTTTLNNNSNDDKNYKYDTANDKNNSSNNRSTAVNDDARTCKSSNNNNENQKTGCVCFHGDKTSKDYDKLAMIMRKEEKKKKMKKKGDLRLQFDIVFPAQLSPQQKVAIRHALTELT